MKTKSFEELKIPFAVIATDIRTGEAVVFTKGSLVDSIRASCAYPGMFPPVEIDGRSYVDGMLAYSVPTTPARQMGAERVLGRLSERPLGAGARAAPHVRGDWPMLFHRPIPDERHVEEGR